MWRKLYSIAQLCLVAVHTIDTCIRIGLKVGCQLRFFVFFGDEQCARHFFTVSSIFLFEMAGFDPREVP